MLETYPIPKLVKLHHLNFPTDMCCNHTGRQNVYGDTVSVCDICLPRKCVTCFRQDRETCMEIQGTKFEVCEECARDRDHIAGRIQSVWSGPRGIAEFVRLIQQDRTVKNVLLGTLLSHYNPYESLEDLQGLSIWSYAACYHRHDILTMIEDFSTALM